MTSNQPINISYIEQDMSVCRVPTTKNYKKGSIMYALTIYSPIFAYLAQISNLDTLLDSEYFQGTCFAPSEHFSNLYYSQLQNEMDIGSARQAVLYSILNRKMSSKQLFETELVIPTKNRDFQIRTDPKQNTINRKYIITKGDMQCSNGTLHFINGLLKPYFL